jgi:hypothetical protein
LGNPVRVQHAERGDQATNTLLHASASEPKEVESKHDKRTSAMLRRLTWFFRCFTPWNLGLP